MRFMPAGFGDSSATPLPLQQSRRCRHFRPSHREQVDAEADRSQEEPSSRDAQPLQESHPLPPPPRRGYGGCGWSHLQNPGEQHLLQPQLQRPNAPSYKDVLLRWGGFDHHGRLCLSSAVEGYVAAQKPEFSMDSWQVVKSKRPWPYTMPQAASDGHRQQERCSLFLQKTKGLCFNCLAQDHKVASCHHPTRC
jgi:hypothetical protein